MVLTSENIDAIFGFLRRVVTGDIPVSTKTRAEVCLWVMEHAHIEPFMSKDDLMRAMRGDTP